MHRTTVARAAKAQAKSVGKPLVFHRGHPGKAITMTTQAKRLAFCQQHLHDNFVDVVNTDRKRFVHMAPGTAYHGSYWSYKGDKWDVWEPNHPNSYNAYAGLTIHGLTNLHEVAGSTGYTSQFQNQHGVTSKNITSGQYYHVVLDGILPEAARIFPGKGIYNFRLQQDNDPTHKKASQQAVQAFNAQHGSKVRIIPDWPPNSPDLSPIENLWGIVQHRVDARGVATFEGFKEAVVEEWGDVNLTLCQHLMQGMQRRMRQCVQRHGGKLPNR